ncbi:MAG: WbqC family protein, partial [Bdellovibrionota bacterium]
MRLVCQQPNYFPWLGYFEQIASADLFIYLDSVQWIRQGRQHRARLPAPGNTDARHWLTIPVHSHGHREKKFKDMKVDHSRNWPRVHWETLRTLYGSAPYFSAQIEPIIRPYFEKADELNFLYDLCTESVSNICEFLGLDAPTVRSSDFPDSGVKSERLINLCREFSADEYYSGLGATRYLDLSAFRAAEIR